MEGGSTIARSWEQIAVPGSQSSAQQARKLSHVLGWQRKLIVLSGTQRKSVCTAATAAATSR